MCKYISSIHASPTYLSGIYLGFRVSFSYLEIIPISGSIIHNLIRNYCYILLHIIQEKLLKILLTGLHVKYPE